MKVMILMKAVNEAAIRAYDRGGRAPTNDALLAMHNFNEQLEKAGVLVDLGGLTPSSRGARIRYSGKRRKVIDGPFTEAKELIAGYSILHVKTMAEALEWAQRSPNEVQDDEEVEVELRPLWGPDTFDPQ